MTKSTFHIFYYNILTIQWHFRNSRFTSEWMHYFFLWSDQKLRCVKVQTESTQEANRWLRICSTEGQRTRLLCSTTATRQHLLTTQSITLVRSVVAVKHRGLSQNPPEIKWLILKNYDLYTSLHTAADLLQCSIRPSGQSVTNYQVSLDNSR